MRMPELRQPTGKKTILITLGVATAFAVVAAVSVAVSGAGGGARTRIPEAVADMARGQHVTAVRAVAVDSARGLGVYSGTDASGAPMVVVGSDDASTPFARTARVFARDDLIIFPESRGSAGAVEWVGVAGLVSKNVGRVEVRTAGGDAFPVSLIGRAFTLSATAPEAFPSTIVAYDTAGAVLATRTVPTPQPPSD
jgi:hypothetical protein